MSNMNPVRKNDISSQESLPKELVREIVSNGVNDFVKLSHEIAKSK